jgi:hypothetical protein
MRETNVSDLPWFAWVAVALLLLGQGTWLFLDARRRRARPWLWGLLGLVQFPMPLVLYWVFVVRWSRRVR